MVEQRVSFSQGDSGLRERSRPHVHFSLHGLYLVLDQIVCALFIFEHHLHEVVLPLNEHFCAVAGGITLCRSTPLLTGWPAEVVLGTRIVGLYQVGSGQGFR